MIRTWAFSVNSDRRPGAETTRDETFRVRTGWDDADILDSGENLALRCLRRLSSAQHTANEPPPMPTNPGEALRAELAPLIPGSARYATDVADRVLSAARAVGASDVHFQPTPDGIEVRWRLDGVLQRAATLPASSAPNLVARLKVMADLLTYKTDLPQEGRIKGGQGNVEMRLSTFPTLHGEKAVVRLFDASGRYLGLEDL